MYNMRCCLFHWSMLHWKCSYCQWAIPFQTKTRIDFFSGGRRRKTGDVIVFVWGWMKFLFQWDSYSGVGLLVDFKRSYSRWHPVHTHTPLCWDFIHYYWFCLWYIWMGSVSSILSHFRSNRFFLGQRKIAAEGGEGTWAWEMMAWCAFMRCYVMWHIAIDPVWL